jgi:haloalkane dehalogenase/tRNA(adenine34) deaminase
MIDALRTPDERFAALPSWSYPPRYFARSDGLRLHYIDEGPRDARRTWLCLHGQPTWSYLYRRMIPVFAAAGDRVIAPDFLGFGRSDKPIDEAVYTFDVHRQTLIELIERLDLGNIRLVVQDWGGLIGLTLPMAMPERFAALLVMNTTLGTGDVPLGEGFLTWRAFSNRSPDMDIARLMQRACPHLGDTEAAAYAAPFPDATFKAGVRRFPNLVPDHPDAGGAALSRAARTFWREHWTGKSLMAIGMTDPVLGPPVMRALHADIRNCPPPMEIAEAGHFAQEWGEPVASKAVKVL